MLRVGKDTGVEVVEGVGVPLAHEPLSDDLDEDRRRVRCLLGAGSDLVRSDTVLDLTIPRSDVSNPARCIEGLHGDRQQI